MRSKLEAAGMGCVELERWDGWKSGCRLEEMEAEGWKETSWGVTVHTRDGSRTWGIPQAETLREGRRAGAGRGKSVVMSLLRNPCNGLQVPWASAHREVTDRCSDEGGLAIWSLPSPWACSLSNGRGSEAQSKTKARQLRLDSEGKRRNGEMRK